MKERPILFSAPMVRAIMAGSKTQTRRIVKPQPPAATREVITYHHPDPRAHFWALDAGSLLDWTQPCRYGEIGDRLYVRETWQHSNHPFGPYKPNCLVFYRADYFDDPHGPDGERSPEGKYREWRPSIHMPRAASRIDLEITGVRAERLQDISEEDAKAEGADCLIADNCTPADRAILDFPLMECGSPYRNGYALLWDAINGDGAWAANPWVWVVEFRRVKP